MRVPIVAAILLLSTACGDDTKQPPVAGSFGDAARAAPQAMRPLTDADIDHYVAVTVELKKSKGESDPLSRIATSRGLPMPEYLVIHARIASALMAVVAGVTVEDGARNQADVDFVKARRARLEATLGN